MIDEAIVHVGMHKTGSSSIQEAFSKHSHPDLEYLSLGAANHSAFMATLLLDEPETYFRHVNDRISASEARQLQVDYMGRFQSELANVRKKRVLISAEFLSLPRVTPEMLEKLRIVLESYCKSIRIVGYVRPPVAYMQSAFQQRLKGGDFSHFSWDALYPRYRSRFMKLDDVFGRENVDLYPFRTENLHSGDVVTDFAWRQGIKTDGLISKRSNESLSLEAAAVLYAARVFGFKGSYRGYNDDEDRLVSKISSLGDEKVIFSKRLVEPIIESQSEDLDWINNRLEESIVDAPNEGDDGISGERDLFLVAKKQLPALRDLVQSGAADMNEFQTLINEVGNLRLLESHGPLVLDPSCSELNDFKYEFGGCHGNNAGEVLRVAEHYFEAKDPVVSSRLRQLAKLALRNKKK